MRTNGPCGRTRKSAVMTTIAGRPFALDRRPAIRKQPARPRTRGLVVVAMVSSCADGLRAPTESVFLSRSRPAIVAAMIVFAVAWGPFVAWATPSSSQGRLTSRSSSRPRLSPESMPLRRAYALRREFPHGERNKRSGPYRLLRICGQQRNYPPGMTRKPQPRDRCAGTRIRMR